jgi:hypothetical protein
MKTYGGVGVYTQVFLTSAIVGGEWSASRPCRFISGERAPGIHWVGGWVSPIADLDDMKKLKFFPPPGLELRPPGRPARSQSLYRVRSPGSQAKYGSSITFLFVITYNNASYVTEDWVSERKFFH